MRLALKAANPLEWLALRAGLVPTPAAEAWGGLATSGVVVAAVRTGVTARLAQGPATAETVAGDLGLDPVPTRLLLDCLRSARHVTFDRGTGAYRLSRTARRWLDPEADLAVARFVNAAGDYFDWWRDLHRVVETGRPVAHHDVPPDDPYWRRYILGQLDLARLSAPEVARKLVLLENPRRVLDIGGGHGWYSAALCRRYPQLEATVFDLPGSARIGREIIDAAGPKERVTFHEGDVRADAALPPDNDAVLCFNLLHHLDELEIPALFAKAHTALKRGGTLAVLDGFAEPGRRSSAAANQLGLFVYLTSGSQVHTPDRLKSWLREAGFEPPTRARIRRVPGLMLFQARRR
jgi:ubiquinone/menaquinone biosynthesis C-methylase UbiE